ncbi:MAG: glucose 1-dehydrogenase [Alphaproteobacteria bacterium]|jgi:NAD(P)-dependent dehydrogenase (short-subunit alcohol dehydrogenase family)|nr:glucose 1-dehydrogenase [Alphaproteobacteria bacterium]MDP7053391.1 glucose 1-dehydrogenase [Alphaproteobacteria bacterium]MDP7228929.1 glucose 1-dehydrogenase [Alphaproteobacteria bacterium]MDP7461870.1 glucose 1-dehydrogenase [Alphaproteobacteria bacterium]HJM92022.1 glucose 1-dehydrogenase [Alphaproteobacteria bacterium]|tara:strand:+ start:1561 stop:2328 length:768 start_codon:yes stop_codon:yes gene_type:complete
MGRVDDKVALITGGASGIGRATAELMAREDAMVVLTDVQDEAGADVAATIADAGGMVAYHHHDVTDEAAWIKIIEEVRAEYGRLDILVNNAGISGASGVPVEEIALESWRGTMSVNLDGVFLGVKHGVAAMTEGGGSIINTSSILGFVGLPFTSAYSASKGGVRLLSKAVAMECAARGLKIRVNSVHPGFIDTPMVGGAIQKGGPERREAILSSQPTGEMGRPEDIAEGVLYLASDAAKFVTGSELVIDGGYLAR